MISTRCLNTDLAKGLATGPNTKNYTELNAGPNTDVNRFWYKASLVCFTSNQT